MKSKDTLGAYVHFIAMIDEHIKELREMPGQVVGRDQAISELQMLKREVLAEMKK